MIHTGDCIEVLRTMASHSVDALVTDPPAGISFMGKDWDSNKGGREQWTSWMRDVMQECLRVMKPGAHALVWAIPRTSHWTATALEDAGFEIRDVVTHIFGSGFPKSLDISKAIDKAAGAEREVLGHRKSEGGRTTSPNPMDRARDDETGDLIAITAPSTPEAKTWQGFGTALKPASEHWILCRKPLGEKTVATNVLKHGTGGINIDASRVGTEIIAQHQRDFTNAHGNNLGANVKQPVLGITNYTVGRFPANLVLSHNPDCVDEHEVEDSAYPAQCTPGCAVAALDEQSGNLAPRGKYKKDKVVEGEFGTFEGKHNNRDNHLSYGDKGGASRFFYCAKASKSERNAGLTVPSTHPTVKPLRLMRYLIRMVTPPGGIVLDPFTGSGSTGVAALQEGFQFIGIEREQEYVTIAEARMESAYVE